MTGSNDTSAIGDAKGVDLNTANREQLEQVGGLKGKRSEDLISHRPFNSWGDVEKVPGFSQKMVEDLKSAGATLGGKSGDDDHGSGSHAKSGGSSAKGRDEDEHRSGSKASSSSRDEDHRSSSHDKDRDSSSGGNESDEDLKSREYTDAQGNVHHHTKTYEEQHGGDKK
jgi:hypothetical protein